MNIFYLSIGSNVDPARNIPLCLKILKERFQVLRISSVYETDPVGPSGPQPFWNLAVAIATTQSRHEVEKQLHDLETELGRKRDPANRFAPRTVDLDLLPQEGYHQQAFVMIPLAEIAPEERNADTGKTFRELAQALADRSRKFRKMELL